ncbi:MAG: chemotaxis protein CheW [Bacteriovorax sp.]|nr:chemotaxis protein CheW [Bacteriovorax sp.]
MIDNENLNTDVLHKIHPKKISQLCGFKIGNGFYAISVLEVQEVIKPQLLTQVPSAPEYVRGLVNLRGQIVTAISLRSLFGLEDDHRAEYMNIIVRSGESLYALMVDEILDVIDVEDSTFEKTPETLDDKIRRFINGVYKLDHKLLILLALEKILNTEN